MWAPNNPQQQIQQKRNHKGCLYACMFTCCCCFCCAETCECCLKSPVLPLPRSSRMNLKSDPAQNHFCNFDHLITLFQSRRVNSGWISYNFSRVGDRFASKGWTRYDASIVCSGICWTWIDLTSLDMSEIRDRKFLRFQDVVFVVYGDCRTRLDSPYSFPLAILIQ